MVQLSQCNHPGCEVSCQLGTNSTCIVASPMLCSGQPNGRESCIMLESGLTHSQTLSLAIDANLMLHARNAANKATDGCAQHLCMQTWYGNALHYYRGFMNGSTFISTLVKALPSSTTFPRLLVKKFHSWSRCTMTLSRLDVHWFLPVTFSGINQSDSFFYTQIPERSHLSTLPLELNSSTQITIHH